MMHSFTQVFTFFCNTGDHNYIFNQERHFLYTYTEATYMQYI